MRASTSVCLLTGVWILMIAVGFAIAADFEITSGTQGIAPAHWPVQSKLPHSTHRPVIVMFAHPKCPCTRASLRQLGEIMSDDRHDAIAIVAFMRPDSTAEDEGEDWTSGEAWELAGQIPRTARIADAGATEATRFGARTSGHVVVYDNAGSLRFSGGITGSRGHAGDNHGKRAVLAHLLATDGDSQHDVFGCGLGGR